MPLRDFWRLPPDRTPDTAPLREEESLRKTGNQEGEYHSDRDQLEVGDREVPPSLQQRRLELPLDAEALETVDYGTRHDVKVLADRVELGEPVEREEER